jgi:hypothetical protein
MQKTTSTEPMAQMLRSIALQRRTGLLRVERFGERGKEQGEIYFEVGRPMHAQTGQETGNVALQRISSWKNITCSFDGIDRPYPGDLFMLPVSKEQSIEKRPVFRRVTTQPLVRRVEAPEEFKPTQLPNIPKLKRRLTTRLVPETLSLLSDQPSKTPYPVSLSMPDRPPKTPHPESLSKGRSLLTLPGRQVVFKQRGGTIPTHALQQMERRERIIFSLLNGSRTIQDIAQLIQCTEAEVELALVHLTMRGYAERVLEPQSAPSLEEKLMDLFSHSTQNKNA